MDRVIGHLDLDYFYAQVEEVENPAIRDRPVIVCVFSGRTEDSGVVSTSNYRARALGVRSGMPIIAAKKALESADPVVVRMVISKYEAVSERVMELVRPHADVLEQTGIDEAFLDLTRASGGDYSAAATLAKEIKGSILREERLTCSIGVGRSKAVAKLGSDLSKPDGLKVVPPAETATFMGPLEVGRLYGVGPKTAKALEGLGIRTVEELARADVSVLTDSFGRKLGVYLRDAAGGLDSEPVRGDLAPTQLSRVITLKEDTTDAEEAMAQLGPALADLAARVSAQKTTFRTLAAIAILTDLSTKTRSRTFDTPVNDLAAVRDVLEELFSQLSETVDREFRRVGVRVSDLSSGQDQKSLGEFMAPW